MPERTMRLLLPGLLFLAIFLGTLMLPKDAEASSYAGVATWYDLSGNTTAGGDVLGYWDQTCASPLDYYGQPIYPLGSKLRVHVHGYGVGRCVVTDTGDMSLYGVALDLNIGFAQRMGLPLWQGVYPITITRVRTDPTWFYGRQYF